MSHIKEQLFIHFLKLHRDLLKTTLILSTLYILLISLFSIYLVKCLRGEIASLHCLYLVYYLSKPFNLVLKLKIYSTYSFLNVEKKDLYSIRNSRAQWIHIKLERSACCYEKLTLGFSCLFFHNRKNGV